MNAVSRLFLARRWDRPAAAIGVLWLAMVAPASAQGAPRPWLRVVRGDVEVVGNADAVSLHSLSSRVASVREALTALVPATTRIAVPVTVIVDCDGSHTATIVERAWRVYVMDGCGISGNGDRAAAEGHARIVLRRTVQSLPLWLEIGVARLAAAAERAPSGGFRFATFEAADVRGYLEPRMPVREVFSARRTSDAWQNRTRRVSFIRQSLVYVHRVIQVGDIGACTTNAGDTDNPAERLRQCLRSDIDSFDEGAMARWPDGLAPVLVDGAVEPTPAVEHPLSGIEWKARVTDALLGSGAASIAKRRLTEWGLTAESGPALPGLLARLAEATGETGKARQLYESAVAAHPDPTDAYHYASALLAPAVRAGTIEHLPTSDAIRAGALLDVAVRAQPLPDAVALQGIAQLASGDHSRAIESLYVAVDSSRDETYALWLARAYAAGRLTASARRLAESLRVSSDRVEVESGAARLLRDLPVGEGDAAGVPVLPPLAAGEQRTRGRLLSIDCQDDWVSLVVETPHGTERFVTARASLLRLISFGPPPAPATCGPRRDAEPVVVNWRTVTTQPPYAVGVASAVAFMGR